MEAKQEDVVRNTRKSRLVGQFADTIASLVSEGNNAPSKSDIVKAIVDESLKVDASIAVRTMLEDETANSLEPYFFDACRLASRVMGVGETPAAYHFVTRNFYKCRGIPRSLEEAKAFVVCFANGQRGKAAGVRFPTIEDEPDAMLLVATQKSVEVINKSIETHMGRLNAMAQSSALPGAVKALVEAATPTSAPTSGRRLLADFRPEAVN